MYTFTFETELRAELAALWSVVTDVAGWPSWDPHEEAARLDGPFAAGTRGFSQPHGAPPADWTLTEVTAAAGLRRWASECTLPGGRLVGVTEYADLGAGRVRCRRTVTASGPCTPLFRFWFGPRMARDAARTATALEAETARRATAAA